VHVWGAGYEGGREAGIEGPLRVVVLVVLEAGADVPVPWRNRKGSRRNGRSAVAGAGLRSGAQATVAAAAAAGGACGRLFARCGRLMSGG
jgi:hypothetical protein